jgi:hypothetical protein
MMASKRVVVVVLGLAILGGIVLASMGGIEMRAQQAQTEGTNVPTQHSVKVTLASDGNECQLYSVSPEKSGVYPSDQLVINVENGCTTPANVEFIDFKLVSPKGGPPSMLKGLPKSVSINPGDRQRIPVQVPPASDDQLKVPLVFEYSVSAPKQKKPGPIKGTVYFCRKPPCPPPS